MINATYTDDQRNLLGFVTDTKKYSPTYSRQTTITNALVSHSLRSRADLQTG